MRIVWSLPVRGERLSSHRGDLVRARALIDGLRDHGHEVTVLSSGEESVGELGVLAYRRFFRPLLPRKVALVLRDVGRWLHGWRHGGRVARAARRQGADLIVETQVNFAISGSRAAVQTSLPLVLDDCSPASEEIALGAGLPALARQALAAQIRAASIVVVSSEEVRERLVVEGAVRDKIRVIGNGVDPLAYERLDRRAVRDRLGLGRSCVLCFVGSFQPWHRVDLLVSALAELAVGRDVRLVLIGDGPGLGPALETGYRLGLRRHIQALGAIPHEEIPALLAAADIGVLPGTNDYGHPMKLVEYAAAALPSVAPDLAPVRRVVEDGITGLLFEPGSTEALTSALLRLIVHPDVRSSLGAEARNRARSSASWRRRAEALCEVVPVPALSETERG